MKKYFMITILNKKEITRKEFLKKAYKNMLKLEKYYKDEVIIEDLLDINLELQRYYKYFNRSIEKLEQEYWDLWEII